MQKKIFLFLFLFAAFSSLHAQIPLPIRQLLHADYMKGATFSLKAVHARTGKVLYSYEEEREVIPASVLKLVTTATALELLGETYRFPTVISYDGDLHNGILNGNIYIEGSGDPSLGSTHFSGDRTRFTPDQMAFLSLWTEAVRQAGIKEIRESVVADESLFDLENISPKWLWEDMGNYYGAGSYGLNLFDNLFYLTLSTGNAGSRPVVVAEEPTVGLTYRNELLAASVATDSAFILGAPFSRERALQGVLPANRPQYTLKGDIPDPPLFLANLFTEQLRGEGIHVEESPTSCRILTRSGKWLQTERNKLTTTYSPPLREIVRITNLRSHNLYADALLKTIGLQNNSPLPLSSFGRGVERVRQFWKEKGIDTGALWIYDGSGLSPIDKVSASFMVDVLLFMNTEASASEAFIRSIPQAGKEGTVVNFLRGTPLEGRARLKSGGMSRVKSYAGYITLNGEEYAVSLFVNNYRCEGREMTRALEKLLVSLF